jgi:hypothetical protein
MTSNEAKELGDRCSKCSAGSKFVLTAYMYCGTFATQKSFSAAARKGIWNFAKCVERSLNFAIQSLGWVSYCLRDEYLRFYREMVPITPGASMYPNNMPIPEEIVFNFDAFTFSARTAFERSVLQSLRPLGEESFARIESLHHDVFEKHVKHGLLPIRNEVVHHGDSGSTSSYAGSISDSIDGHSLEIASNFTINDEEKAADLLDILKRLAEDQMTYSWQVLGTVLGFYFITLGPPTWNAGLSSGDHTIRFSDFDIPNFDLDTESLSDLWPIGEDEDE